MASCCPSNLFYIILLFLFCVFIPRKDVRVYARMVNMACSANKTVAVRMTERVTREVALACVRPVGQATSAQINVRLVSTVHNVRSNANVSKVDHVITLADNVNARPAIWVSSVTMSVRSTLTAWTVRRNANVRMMAIATKRQAPANVRPAGKAMIAANVFARSTSTATIVIRHVIVMRLTRITVIRWRASVIARMAGAAHSVIGHVRSWSMARVVNWIVSVRIRRVVRRWMARVYARRATKVSGVKSVVRRDVTDRIACRNAIARMVRFAHMRRVNAAVPPVGVTSNAIVLAIWIIMVKTVNSSVIATIMPVVILKMALAPAHPAGWVRNAIRSVSRSPSVSAVSYNANVMRIIRSPVILRPGSVSASRVGEVGFPEVDGWVFEVARSSYLCIYIHHSSSIFAINPYKPSSVDTPSYHKRIVMNFIWDVSIALT